MALDFITGEGEFQGKKSQEYNPSKLKKPNVCFFAPRTKKSLETFPLFATKSVVINFQYLLQYLILQQFVEVVQLPSPVDLIKLIHPKLSMFKGRHHTYFSTLPLQE